MKDNDVMKALECCGYYITTDECEWSNCPFVTEKGCSLELDELQKLALDIINLQRAEIKQKDTEINILIRKKETLQDELAEKQAEIERLQEHIKHTNNVVKQVVEDTKSEARKEFAERLKENGYVPQLSLTGEAVVDVEDIDNLLEEMESESNV